MATSIPDQAALHHDLKEVRRAGLVRLHGRALPALEAAARTVAKQTPGAASGAARPPGAAVEALLRRVVSGLDAGTLRTAAEYTLGLAQGTRDWPAASRRARAASVYGVSVERFRKDHEVMVLGQIAEHIALLMAEATEAGPAPATTTGDAVRAGTHRTVAARVAGRAVPLTLHVHPVDLLRDVDVVVSPANVYFALPKTYKSSVAASLRRSAATRGVTGEVLDDPLPAELRAWADRQGTAGRAVLPGTVVPTGTGALAEQGVRRIYHAAVAVPRAGTNDYDVLPADVTRATSRALALLARESARHDPPLRSVCFPLLGSGRGGLPYHISVAAIWAALEAELARGADWDLHFVVRGPEAAAAVERVQSTIRPSRDQRPTG
ncbi:hypothetical protein ABZX40_07620 [Streptomyces sp. NPDC004610]|uniref:hypothetical protein n=1 Tax=unclassified Streptomyces TaxID=2593676 RepID=UPI0033B520A9